MARNGSGTYSLPQAPFVSGTTISSTAVNSDFSDIATALTGSIAADGQTPITANLPMSGYKHTGVANASARNDYAAAGQVQDGSFTWCGTAGGTADALTLTPTPAITAYATGQKFRFKAGSGANTGATTVAISGLTTKAVQLNDAALAAGDIAANKYYEILYDGTAFQLQRVSGAAATTIATSGVTFTNTDRILGRDTSGGGAGEELTLSAVLDFVGSAAQGDILYRDAATWTRLGAGTSGQFLKTQGAGANPAWDTVSAGPTFAAEQATTSGTAFDFTGISASAKRIQIILNGVSLSGTDHLLVQIGDAGGIENTGYLSVSGDLVANITNTTGFCVRAGGNSGNLANGILTLTPIAGAGGATWILSGAFGAPQGPQIGTASGSKTISAAPLDRIRLTRTGTDTFDAGSVNILVEV